MSGTAVDAAIAEIKDRLAAFAPEHEGLKDFALLNLSEDAHAQVAAAIEIYDRRVGLLNAALAALIDLRADGHPDIDTRDVSAAVLNDLRENARTIEAALAKFDDNTAVALNLSGGAPTLKAEADAVEPDIPF